MTSHQTSKPLHNPWCSCPDVRRSHHAKHCNRSPKTNIDMTPKIRKPEAIAIANRGGAMQLRTNTTAFANVNSSQEVWWFDIPLAKVVAERYDAIDLLVVTSDVRLLHHLRVPVAWLRENLSNFHVRIDKQAVSLELSSREVNLFQDTRSGSKKIQFVRFLVNSVALGIRVP